MASIVISGRRIITNLASFNLLVGRDMGAWISAFVRLIVQVLPTLLSRCAEIQKQCFLKCALSAGSGAASVLYLILALKCARPPEEYICFKMSAMKLTALCIYPHFGKYIIDGKHTQQIDGQQSGGDGSTAFDHCWISTSAEKRALSCSEPPLWVGSGESQ